MSECGKRVGKSVVTYPCVLDSSHGGPCMSPDNPPSIRARTAWSRESYQPDPLALEPLSPLISDVREPGRIKPPKGHRPEDQPLPVPTGGPSMHDKLIEMVKDRKQLGLSRYGSLLQAHNGRDALRDILEELVDACVYVLQAIEERDHPQP